jgi:hypothetical protein
MATESGKTKSATKAKATAKKEEVKEKAAAQKEAATAKARAATPDSAQEGAQQATHAARTQPPRRPRPLVRTLLRRWPSVRSSGAWWLAGSSAAGRPVRSRGPGKRQTTN